MILRYCSLSLDLDIILCNYVCSADSFLRLGKRFISFQKRNRLMSTSALPIASTYMRFQNRFMPKSALMPIATSVLGRTISSSLWTMPWYYDTVHSSLWTLLCWYGTTSALAIATYVLGKVHHAFGNIKVYVCSGVSEKIDTCVCSADSYLERIYAYVSIDSCSCLRLLCR